MIKYAKGEILKARVTSVENYGVFACIDDEYSGLIHISEITGKFVNDINDFFEVGDIINVKILEIPNEKNKLKLSAKGLNENLYKKKKGKIKESVFGFYLLKLSLPIWIEKKIEEIDKKF